MSNSLNRELHQTAVTPQRQFNCSDVVTTVATGGRCCTDYGEESVTLKQVPMKQESNGTNADASSSTPRL